MLQYSLSVPPLKESMKLTIVFAAQKRRPRVRQVKLWKIPTLYSALGLKENVLVVVKRPGILVQFLISIALEPSV